MAADVSGLRRTRSSRRDDLVPYGAVAAAVLAIVFLLPSAPRPPQTPPTQSAELSPDAPPDENTDSILSTLDRGQSGTGDGTGVGEGPGDGAGQQIVVNGTTLPPKPPPPAAACPFGYGSPPRQTFSIYSPPCAAAFVGDNGGSTSRGVDANEIRIVVQGGTEGWVVDDPAADEDSVGQDRTWRVLQKWFNTHYQLYGRKLRLYKMGLGGSDEERRAQAGKVANEIKAFAALASGATNGVELARQKVIYFGESGDEWDESFMEQRRPYVWTWHANATLLERIAGEYICKRLANRATKFAGPEYSNRTRRFGIVYDNAEGKRDSGPVLKREIEAQCPGAVVEMLGFTGLGASDFGASEQSTAVAKLRQAEVTSVVAPLGWSGMISLTTTASTQGYFPEYVITGEGNNDHNTLARLMDQKAWTGHTFGISSLEIEQNGGAVGGGTLAFSDGYRAYKEMDPANEPADGPVRLFFYPLQGLVNGIQLAGPKLTPLTLEAGLFNAPRRQGPPNWAEASGYSLGNHGYGTQVGEIWWDPAVVDSGGTPAAYRWTRGGRRWGLGQLPPGETTVFAEGNHQRPESWAKD